MKGKRAMAVSTLDMNATVCIQPPILILGHADLIMLACC